MVSPRSKRNGNYSTAIMRHGGSRPGENARRGESNASGNRQKFEKKYAPVSSSSSSSEGSPSAKNDDTKRLVALEAQVRQALASFRGGHDASRLALPAANTIKQFITRIESVSVSDAEIDASEFHKCLLALGVSPEDSALLLDKFGAKNTGYVDAKMLSKHFLPSNYGVGSKLAAGRGASTASSSPSPSVGGDAEAASEERAMKQLHRRVIERVLVKSKTQNIKDAFRQYDSDRRGYLTLAQFRACARDHGFVGTDVERLIQFLDRDDQGTISFHTFSGDVKLGASQAYPKSPPKKRQLAQPLGRHNASNDNSPSKSKANNTVTESHDPLESIRAKLRQRVMGHSKSIREVFLDFDDDGNGYLDYDEFKRFMAKYNFTQAETSQAIEYLDRDFSGTIDYDEFAAGLLFFRPPAPVAPAPSSHASGDSSAAAHSKHSSAGAAGGGGTGSSKLSPAKAEQVLHAVQQKLGEKLESDRSSRSARKRLRDEFAKFDSENKRGLDYQEFGAFLVSMGVKLKTEELSALVALIDTDGSEIIEFDKFTKLYRASAGSSDDSSDDDGDGDTEGDGNGRGTANRSSKDAQLLAVFNKYDIDGSGYLDYDEFAQLMRDYGFSESDILHVIKQVDHGEAVRAPKHTRAAAGGRVSYKAFASVVRQKKLTLRSSPSKPHGGDAAATAVGGNSHALWVSRVLQKHRSLEDAFRGHDTDSSGELDYDEFRRFMKHYGMKSDGAINALIDELDADGNGTISLDEFLHAFARAKAKPSKPKQDARARLALLRESELAWIQSALRDFDSVHDAFRAFDSHGRNELTYQQFHALMERFGITDDDDIALLLKRLDVDNSGSIDVQEFISVFNDQRVMQHARGRGDSSAKRGKPAPSAAVLQRRERASQQRKAEEAWLQHAIEAHGSVRAAFEAFDVDQSGELDCDEFRQLMHAFGLTSSEHIEALLKRLDVDDSGAIDYDELATIFYDERLTGVTAAATIAHSPSRRVNIKSPTRSAAEEKKARIARQRELELKWMKCVLNCHASIDVAFNEYDDDGNGELDHSEFTRFMKRYGIVRNEDIASLIKRLDLDGSGSIDFDEFAVVFNPLRINQGHRSSHLTGVFAGGDDEPLDPDELESVLEIERELASRMLEKTRDLRSAFRKYDLNGNGRLEYKEFRQVLRAYRFPELEIRKVIRHLDRDVSGFIDYKEFIAGFSVSKENDRTAVAAAGGVARGAKRGSVQQGSPARKTGAAAVNSKHRGSALGAHGGSGGRQSHAFDPAERLKKNLLAKILSTYGTVQSVFRQYDSEQQGRLTESQFEALVTDHGMARSDALALLDVFDQDRSGTIEYEEFLAQLVVRGAM